jgi:hypothetical protein
MKEASTAPTLISTFMSVAHTLKSPHANLSSTFAAMLFMYRVGTQTFVNILQSNDLNLLVSICYSDYPSGSVPH